MMKESGRRERKNTLIPFTLSFQCTLLSPPMGAGIFLNEMTSKTKSLGRFILNSEILDSGDLDAVVLLVVLCVVEKKWSDGEYSARISSFHFF